MSAAATDMPAADPAALAELRTALAAELLAARCTGLIGSIPAMLPEAGPKYMRVDQCVTLGCGTVVRLCASVEVVE